MIVCLHVDVREVKFYRFECVKGNSFNLTNNKHFR